MSERRFESLLAALPDTDAFFQGGTDELPDVMAEWFPGREPSIVADENTWLAAGEKVHDAFVAAGARVATPFRFPGTKVLEPEYRHVETLRNAWRSNDTIPVAVGAGTINDLVKRAAFESSRPYVVVATAASMDGITSFGAALVRNGLKQTMSCPAPRMVLADVSVIKNAPPAMTAAGYADLASELTAGADWLLADAAGAEPIHEKSWAMIQPHLEQWLTTPGRLAAGDETAYRELFDGLCMNGFAMQCMQSSRPASGAEHLFSHVWEMEHLQREGMPVSHGFKVAIGTLIATAVYEEVLGAGVTRFDPEQAVRHREPWEARAERVKAAYRGSPLIEPILAICAEKYGSDAALRARVERINEAWPVLCERLSGQIVPFRALRSLFIEAGVPVEPGQISLDLRRVRDTFNRAHMIRTRYTVLDFLYDTGLFEPVADAVCSPGAYFSE